MLLVSYDIAAQPVIYKGTRFRSSLEARWAAIFDVLDWAYPDEDRRRWLYTWQYEPQGFLLPSCGVEGCNKHPERPYLPDFYLPYLGLWVEVKGPVSALDLTLMEWANHCLRSWKQGSSEFCFDGTGCGGLLLLGSPAQDRAPVLFSDEGVVCWDWDRAAPVGFPGQPGGVLSGQVEKDCIKTTPTAHFSAGDLLDGIDLGLFALARRKAPQLPKMPETFPEIEVPEDLDTVPADVDGGARRQIVRLPRPPIMLGCLDRAEASLGAVVVRQTSYRVATHVWESQSGRGSRRSQKTRGLGLSARLREFSAQIKKGPV